MRKSGSSLGDAEVHDLHVPSPAIMMLAGLMSRWITPSAVRVIETFANLRADIGGFHRERSVLRSRSKPASVAPAMNSMAM